MACKCDYDGKLIKELDEKLLPFFLLRSILSFCFTYRFRERQMFVSSGNHMTLFVRRLMANDHDEETEYLDGAYSFFNG